MQLALKFLKIWMVCLVGLEAFCLLVAFPLAGGYQTIILSRSWRVAAGTIVEVDRGNHESATVGYLVDGQEFRRSFSRPGSELGESIDIYYSPESPALSSLERPDRFLRGQIRFFALAGLIQGTFLAVLIQAHRLVRSPLTSLAELTLRPRVMMTGIAIGVLVGVISRLFSAGFSARMWLADACVLGGMGLLCARAFQISSGVSWVAFIKSRAVVIGATLILAGEMATWNY